MYANKTLFNVTFIDRKTKSHYAVLFAALPTLRYKLFRVFMLVTITYWNCKAERRGKALWNRLSAFVVGVLYYNYYRTYVRSKFI